MFLYTKGIKETFAAIVESHWKGLIDENTGKNGSLSYSSYSIIKKVADLKTKRGITRNFFLDLSENKFALLKKIITGLPSDLKTIVNNFESNQSNGRYPLLYVNKKETQFFKDIVSVFNYDSFARKKTSWCAYDFCDRVDINVCPYCNRNYTFTIKARDKGYVLN